MSKVNGVPLSFRSGTQALATPPYPNETTPTSQAGNMLLDWETETRLRALEQTFPPSGLISKRSAGGTNPLPYYDLKADFGAKGDNTTVDDPAFAQAMSTVGQSWLGIPDGKYVIDTTIQRPLGQRWSGASRLTSQIVWRNPVGAPIITTAPGTLIADYGLLENFLVDGGNVANTVGLNLSQIIMMTLRSLELTNCGVDLAIDHINNFSMLDGILTGNSAATALCTLGLGVNVATFLNTSFNVTAGNGNGVNNSGNLISFIGCNFEGSSVGSVGVNLPGGGPTQSLMFWNCFFENWTSACFRSATNTLNTFQAYGGNWSALPSATAIMDLSHSTANAIPGFIVKGVSFNNLGGSTGPPVAIALPANPTNVDISGIRNLSGNGTLITIGGNTYPYDKLVINALLPTEWVGVGAPTLPYGCYPKTADTYKRTDTPTVANQRMYYCTAGGASPTWVGVF